MGRHLSLCLVIMAATLAYIARNLQQPSEKIVRRFRARSQFY